MLNWATFSAKTQVKKNERTYFKYFKIPPIYSPIHGFTGFILTGNAAATAQCAAQEYNSTQQEHCKCAGAHCWWVLLSTQYGPEWKGQKLPILVIRAQLPDVQNEKSSNERRVSVETRTPWSSMIKTRRSRLLTLDVWVRWWKVLWFHGGFEGRLVAVVVSLHVDEQQRSSLLSSTTEKSRNETNSQCAWWTDLKHKQKQVPEQMWF